MPTTSNSNHYYIRDHTHQGNGKKGIWIEVEEIKLNICSIYEHRKKLPKYLDNLLNLIKEYSKIV